MLNELLDNDKWFPDEDFSQSDILRILRGLGLRSNIDTEAVIECAHTICSGRAVVSVSLIKY